MTENLTTFELLVRVETRLWNQLDRVLLAEHDVSLAQLLALRVLKDNPGSRIQDLAAAIDISPSGASKVVDRVARAGLVDRVADVSDRRASRLHLTASGGRLVQAGSTTSERWLRDRFKAPLGPPGVGQLQSLLATLSDGHGDQRGIA